jgi:flagellar M-ring protein FliF
MNFLNKGLAQIGDLFRSMTPGARITAALLLVVIVVSVAFLFNHQFAAGDAYLFGGEPIPPTQLPAMLASFAKAGLPEPEMEGNRMRVPRGKQPAYIAAAADGGALPHNFGDTFKAMINNNNPFISKQQRADMAKFALQDELSKIISKMAGIETAGVMYDEQTQTGLNAKRLVSASVSVKPIGTQPLTSTQVQMIRHLVAGAKVGLTPESVSVVDMNGRTFAGGSPDSSGDVTQDKYLNTKQSYEQQYTDRISEALSFVKGAVVSVNVELHPVLEETENNNKVDPKPIVIDSTETNKTLNSSTAQPAGRPGLASQGGVNAPAVIGAGANGSKTEEESGTTHQRSVASNQSTIIRRAGLTPKRVTVAVGVPSNYFEDVWRQRNPSPAGTEPKKPDAAALALIETEVRSQIQKYVLPIIGTADAAADLANVVVQPFQSMPVATIEKPTPVDHAFSWFTDHASNVGLGVFGLFSLLMVRSIVRSVPGSASSTPPDRENAATQPAEDVEEETEAPQPATPQRLRRRKAKSGPSLRDELVEIVREDPDAAANILRSWIGPSN